MGELVCNANVHEVTLNISVLTTQNIHKEVNASDDDVWVLVFILLICVECWWLAG